MPKFSGEFRNIKNERESFMNREEYLEKREEMLNEAQRLVDEGSYEKFNLIKSEIEKLDKDFENEAKAQANLRALNDVKTARKDFINTKGQVIGMKADTEDMLNSMEYRKAFMNSVLKGEPLPIEFRNEDTVTKTADAGLMIPTTVMERIIEKIESTGMILPLVTRTAYKGGLTIPTSSAKPTASWVSEGAGSDIQKKSVSTAASGSITFAYHKLRCAVAVTLEVETMALNVFESTLINNVAQAMTKAIEQSIISGNGSGQPKGFLTESAPTGQGIEITEGTGLTYKKLVECEAALPLAYENDAVWFMTKKTFMEFVGMLDDNKQPIARVNYGISGRPERTLLGRTVILNDYMNSFSTSVTADTIIAALFNPKDYILNTNLNVTIKKYEDNSTDDIVTKAIMLVDGKTVDVNSLVTLTIKNV